MNPGEVRARRLREDARLLERLARGFASLNADAEYRIEHSEADMDRLPGALRRGARALRLHAFELLIDRLGTATERRKP